MKQKVSDETGAIQSASYFWGGQNASIFVGVDPGRIQRGYTRGQDSFSSGKRDPCAEEVQAVTWCVGFFYNKIQLHTV